MNILYIKMIAIIMAGVVGAGAIAVGNANKPIETPVQEKVVRQTEATPITMNRVRTEEQVRVNDGEGEQVREQVRVREEVKIEVQEPIKEENKAGVELPLKGEMKLKARNGK